MKQFSTAVALCALVALSGSAFAQDTSMPAGSNNNGGMSNNSTMNMDGGMNRTDMMKARWAFYNADQREVNRFKAKGFSEADFKAIANISLQTGLDTEYLARQVMEVGRPLSFVAAMYSVPTTALDDDIPGFNAAPGSVTATGAMVNGSTGTSGSTGMSGSTGSMGSTSNASGTVVNVAMSDPQFSTLVAAIRAAGLVDTLNGSGPFTVFAPTNEAFAKLPAGTLENLLKPENKQQLVSILTYHVVPGKIKAADVMGMSNPSMPTTVNGKQLNVKTTAPVMVNSANVIRTDIDASNGVIHVIDTVLMPDSAATSSSSLPPATPTEPATPSTPAEPSTPATPSTPSEPSSPTEPTTPTTPSTP